MLEVDLQVDQEMSKVSTKSGPISTPRIGVASNTGYTRNIHSYTMKCINFVSCDARGKYRDISRYLSRDVVHLHPAAIKIL